MHLKISIHVTINFEPLKYYVRNKYLRDQFSMVVNHSQKVVIEHDMNYGN